LTTRKKRAVLQASDLTRIRAAAKAAGPREHALIEWLYTNGARASEPGLARIDDVDLYSNTVMLTHLKGGLASEPIPLSKRCAEAIRDWLRVRPIVDPAQRYYVFPSTRPGRCYPCRGEKMITVKSRKKTPGAPPPMTLVPCPHCHGTGTRWGISRHEVRRIIETIFTHMLDGDAPPAAIQERVGHKSLSTTFGYMHTTKKARAMVTKTFDEDDES